MKYSKKLGRFGFILIAILGLTDIATHAQTPTPSPTPQPSPTQTLEHEFFKNVLRDQKAIWTSPFHLQTKDVRWLAPLSLGTAALIATDHQTADEDAASDNHSKASRVVSYFGSAYATAGIAGAFYLVGRAGHDSKARETGLLGFEALLDSNLVVLPLKEATGRRRPYQENRGDFFKGGSSFPSGHAINAWSMATVIASEYHEHPAVEITAYGLASAVSIARLAGNYHFLSDVLVGSAMGYGIGRYVYHTHHRVTPGTGGGAESRDRSKYWPSIAPDYNRRAHEYGVAMAWSF
jgi:membrane-associated phospholipid phosphatase